MIVNKCLPAYFAGLSSLVIKVLLRWNMGFKNYLEGVFLMSFPTSNCSDQFKYKEHEVSDHGRQISLCSPRKWILRRQFIILVKHLYWHMHWNTIYGKGWGLKKNLLESSTVSCGNQSFLGNYPFLPTFSFIAKQWKGELMLPK